MLKILLPLLIVLIAIAAIVLQKPNVEQSPATKQEPNTEKQAPTTQNKNQLPVPKTHTIPLRHHTFQTFNNCGPAALSMMLSYFDIQKSQQELGQKLRPYQNPQGNNDDKSVTLEELAKESENLGLIPFHRPNGNIEKIKKFIAADIPVVTRTMLIPNDDIGHYRLIRGYDDTTNQLIQDDSLQAVNSKYTYDDFNILWQPFNFEYLIAVPKQKEAIVIEILGEEIDEKIAWQNAKTNLLAQIQKNPNDTFAKFNLANTNYHLGQYEEAKNTFEDVETKLTFRTLWYQIEPILTYETLGNDQKVFEQTGKILNNHNRAFSELYVIRGNVYKKQQNFQAARQEYEKAIFYNKNLEPEVNKKLQNLN